MLLSDGSKEVENGECLIYLAAWSPANEIVPTPLCVPCVGIMCRDLFGSTRVVHLSVIIQIVLAAAGATSTMAHRVRVRLRLGLVLVYAKVYNSS